MNLIPNLINSVSIYDIIATTTKVWECYPYYIKSSYTNIRHHLTLYASKKKESMGYSISYTISTKCSENTILVLLQCLLCKETERHYSILYKSIWFDFIYLRNWLKNKSVERGDLRRCFVQLWKVVWQYFKTFLVSRSHTHCICLSANANVYAFRWTSYLNTTHTYITSNG